MSAAFFSTQDSGSQQYREFSIDAARNGNNRDLAVIFNNLIPLHDLSYGKIFKRSDNGDLWHINPDNTIAKKITEEQSQFFLRWDKKSLLPDDDLFNKLESIGGLPSDSYCLYGEFIQFPCKIKTIHGLTSDLCILHFSAAPPYQTCFKKMLLLDEIVDVVPCVLALAHDLRMESMLAEEVSMSFCPFLVKTKTGVMILYNGTTAFVSKGEVKGDDIECRVPFSHDAIYKVMDVPCSEITYVIGKWDNRFEELFARYRNMLEDKKSISKGRR